MLTPTRLRDSTNQRWSPGSATVSMGAVTRWPTRYERTTVGSSMAPKCMPTMTTGRPVISASRTSSGVSTSIRAVADSTVRPPVSATSR